ncbi:hypothetical protein V6N13_109628 [Hibiscus sabdariffa]|uniref:Uncharacterized protein n=1 Tax=Hibiscus sabdariffa TaxID=183260 RepID=A0ABR2FQ35_9ROSI
MLMKSHSALCFLSLPRQESRQVLHSTALVDSGSLVWNCISTALLYFNLLLLPYIVHLILNLPRANPQNPLYPFNPEIERTRRKLRQGIIRIMANGQHNGQNPIEGQNPPAPTIRQEPPAPAARLLIPPSPQNNYQQPVRTVRDYLAKDLDGLNPAVTIPEFEAEHFELKLIMFNMLNTLGRFSRSPAENARQHLKSCLEICNSFKIHGVSNDVLKLKFFLIR